MRLATAILAVLGAIAILIALRVAVFPRLKAAMDRARLRRATPQGGVLVFARPRGPALLFAAIYATIGLACLSVGVGSCRAGCAADGDAAGVVVAVFAIPWSLSWITAALGEIASCARRLVIGPSAIVVHGGGRPATYSRAELADPHVLRQPSAARAAPGAPAGDDVVLAFARGDKPVRVSLGDLDLLGHAAQIVEILGWPERGDRPIR